MVDAPTPRPRARRLLSGQLNLTPIAIAKLTPLSSQTTRGGLSVLALYRYAQTACASHVSQSVSRSKVFDTSHIHQDCSYAEFLLAEGPRAPASRLAAGSGTLPTPPGRHLSLSLSLSTYIYIYILAYVY